jgi:hypothetical protein
MSLSACPYQPLEEKSTLRAKIYISWSKQGEPHDRVDYNPMFKADFSLPLPQPNKNLTSDLHSTYAEKADLLYGILFITRASVLDQPLHNIVFLCQFA